METEQRGRPSNPRRAPHTPQPLSWHPRSPAPSASHWASPGHSSAQRDPRWLLKAYGVPPGPAHRAPLPPSGPDGLTAPQTHPHTHTHTHSCQTLPALPPGLADAPLYMLGTSHPV